MLTLRAGQRAGNGEESGPGVDGKEPLAVARGEAVGDAAKGPGVPVAGRHHQDLLPNRLRVEDCGVVLPDNRKKGGQIAASQS